MQHLDAVGNVAAIPVRMPSQRRGCMPDTGKLAEGRSSASDATTRPSAKKEKEMLVSTMNSHRLADSRHAGLLLHTAPMLLVIFLAICLAVVDVLYLPASPAAAAVAMSRSLTAAPTPAAANPRVHDGKQRR